MAENFSVFSKECLKLFNYPRIHSMSDDEIAEIFHSSNRCFLVAWMLKLLDSVYREVLASNEDNKELLAELVYSHGFCTQKEKDGFISGQLPGQTQVLILYRMFDFIKSVTSKTETTLNESVQLDDIETLKNRNLNLFPMYGEIKVLTEDEKQAFAASITAEIENLKQLEDNNEEPHEDNIVSNKKTEIKEVMQKIKSNFPEIVTTLDYIKREKNLDYHEEIVINEHSHEILKNCSESAAIISQYIENLKIIKQFENCSGNKLTAKEKSFEQLRDMVKILYDELLSLSV